MTGFSDEMFLESDVRAIHQRSFEMLRVDFNATSLRIKSITNKQTNLTYPVDQEFLYYTGSIDSVQPSGAYIFRPQQQDPAALHKIESLEFLKVFVSLGNEIVREPSYKKQDKILPHGFNNQFVSTPVAPWWNSTGSLAPFPRTLARK